MNSRIRYIDVFRGLAMVAIVVFHCQRIDYLWYLFFSFHVPVFFFISGLLFFPENFTTFKSFLKNRLIKLYLPFVIWYALLFAYWFVFERKYREISISPQQAAIGLFWGSGAEKWIYPGGPIWFLPALFSIELLFYAVIRYIRPVWGIVATLFVLFITGVLISRSAYDLPLGGTSALLSIPFFGVGYLSRFYMLVGDNTGQVFSKTISPVKASVIAALSLALTLLLCTKGSFNLMRCTIDNYLYFLTVPFCGISALLFISYLIRKNKILEWIGRNTIPILAVHAPLIRIFCGIYQIFTGADKFVIKSSVPGVIALTVLTLVACVPFCLIWNYLRAKVSASRRRLF